MSSYIKPKCFILLCFKVYGCTSGMAKCADGLQCFSKENYCDGSIDCYDGSDEPASDTCKGNKKGDVEDTCAGNK